MGQAGRRALVRRAWRDALGRTARIGQRRRRRLSGRRAPGTSAARCRSQRRASAGWSRRSHLVALRRARSTPDSSVGVPDARRGVAAARALIPAEWSGAPAFHLAPMPFDVQRALVASLRGSNAGSCPSIRTFRSPRKRSTIGGRSWRTSTRSSRARTNSCSTERRRIRERALPRLVNGRLRFVVFKRGANGGILYDARDERFHTVDRPHGHASWIQPAQAMRSALGSSGAPRRAVGRRLPATRRRHGELRRRRLGT